MTIKLTPINRITTSTPQIVTKGSFMAGTEGFFVFTFADIEGNLFDPSDIDVIIRNTDGTIVDSATKVDRLDKGEYLHLWDIPAAQDSGIYIIQINFVVDQLSGSFTESFTESFTVAESDIDIITPQVLGFRTFVEYLVGYTQRIPVFHEIGRFNNAMNVAKFTFPRWNQPAGARVFVNGLLRESGYTVDFLKGEVEFSGFLATSDEVQVSYNFRWFTDDEIDNFVAQSVQVFNQYAPHSAYRIVDLPTRYGITISHQAAVFILRRLIMDLNFQEPAKVFGGMERADKVIGSLDTLKKNMEEQLNSWYNEKKKQPYEGLTKTVTVPEFTLPGGRSRWFRMLFKGG